MINLKKFLNLDFYTSELDLFLAAFDQAHPALSASQLQEIRKYDRIDRLRDDPQSTAVPPPSPIDFLE